jgi:hypothetical protein
MAVATLILHLEFKIVNWAVWGDIMVFCRDTPYRNRRDIILPSEVEISCSVNEDVSCL